MGQDREYFGSGKGIFWVRIGSVWVRMELWDEMVEQGDGGRGKG